jgi:hypothetical protein
VGRGFAAWCTLCHMTHRALISLALLTTLACGNGQDTGGTTPVESADRMIAIGAATGAEVPALHGHYDLSGVLHAMSEQPGLVSRMAEIGFPSWRVSLGRWELFTRMADEGECAEYPAEYLATSVEDVLEDRDWFVLEVDADGDGRVDLEDTEEPGNYRFDYLDAVLDEAEAFGAAPYVSVDHVPRALSSGGALDVVDCTFSFANGVSNAPPEDPEVYASAVAHVIAHVVSGWGGGDPREVQYWEFGNEPDLPGEPGEVFWTGTPEEWFGTYAWVAAYVAAYRDADPAWADVRIGGGSFATDGWNEAFFSVMDEAAVPVDFLSVHRYSDDADAHLTTIADARSTVDAWASADPEHFGATELVYAEWGPDLSHIGDTTFQDAPSTAAMHAAVLTGAVEAGVSLTHRALFTDLYGSIAAGVVRGDGSTTRTWGVYRAFDTIAGGERLDTPAEVRVDGVLTYTVLASRRDGVINVLIAHVGGVDEAVAVALPAAAAWTVSRIGDDGAPVEVASGEGETATFELGVGSVAWVTAR